MTSRISFSKISMDHLRRSSALILITFFIYLLRLLAFVIQIQNAYAYEPTVREIRASITTITLPDYGAVMIALLVGLYLAFGGLRWLHSRQQSDLFDSLPVKRETAYRMVFLNSFLIILIPAAICTLLQIVILAVIGQFFGAVIGNLLLTFLFTLLAFLASFTTAALAVIMTGHLVVGLLGYGVFAAYMPGIIAFLIPTYADTFFSTSDSSSLYNIFSRVLNYFSPVSLSWNLVNTDGSEWTLAAHQSYLVGIIIWIAAIGAIGYLLYLRRPSEAAGRAMTFKKANPVIRFLIVIPMALYTGLYLHQLSFQNSLIWLFIGVVCGAVVFHSIVECIYQFDIRGVFSQKKQLAITIVICFGFIGIFMADIFGYDKWMPEKSRLASMDLSFDQVTQRDSQYWGQEPDGITGDTMEQALELIRSADSREDENASRSMGLFGGFTEVQSASDDMISLYVTYHMKDGKEKKRVYSVNAREQADLMDAITATEEFKDDYYSLYTADRSKIRKIEWDNSLEYETLKLTEEEQNELIDTYFEELTSLSYSDMEKTGICSTLIVSHSKAYMPYLGSYSSDAADEYYIYPSFTKTLALLREYGLSPDPLSDYKISRLEVLMYDENYEKEIVAGTIADADVIAKYKNDLILSMYDIYSGDYEDRFTITAYVNTPHGTDTLNLKVTAETGEKLVAEIKK